MTSDAPENPKPRLSTAEVALIYAEEFGWPVVPLNRATKRPITKNGYHDASTDPDLIAEWFAETEDGEVPLIGVVTSPTSGIFVLDCDVEDGVSVGEKTLAEWCAEHGDLPPHPIAQTPTGGLHHFLAWPADGIDLPRRIRCALGIDVLAGRFEGGVFKGGYVAMPPSNSAVGRRRWLVSPRKVKPPGAPAWLLAKIRRADRPGTANHRPFDPVYGPTTRYGAKVLAAKCSEVASCPPGSQENTLNSASVRIGSLVAGGQIDEGEAFNALVGAAMRMVNGGRPWLQKEVERKVRNGMAAGARNPYRPRPRESARQFHDDGSRKDKTTDSADADTASSDHHNDESPLPLFPPLPPSEPFPIEALGPVLADAAAAIARKVQVPEAMAAQSVLAVAALAAQAHANILLPYGQARPLSLYFVTVADSGDRKSAADNEALWPIGRRERTLKEAHDNALRGATIARDAWAAQKRKIENSAKTDLEGKKGALAALGPQPDLPLLPFIVIADLTIEGLAKNWPNAFPALGVFTAEGGQFIGSHGMKEENRLRNAAGYNELWDGQPVKRMRAGDGVTMLYGRRLTIHLMVQPDAASRFLSDPTLRNIGLISRVLVASPDSLAGTRFYRAPAPDDDAAIRSYGARILAILETPLPLAAGTRNELEPRVLVMTVEAESLWCAFSDHVEGQCAATEELRPLKDFAAKIAEHAARIAGVLAIVADHRATEVTEAAMHNAVTLADWYVKEALRLHHAGRLDPTLKRAQDLLDWLRKQEVPEIGFRDILRGGPVALRRKTVADEALRILVDHRWVTELQSPRRVRPARSGGEG